MTERQKMILRLCLCYAQDNLPDIADKFAGLDPADDNLNLNGEEMTPPTEEEFEQLMRLLS